MDKTGSKDNAKTQYNSAFHIHIFEAKLFVELVNWMIRRKIFRYWIELATLFLTFRKQYHGMYTIFILLPVVLSVNVN